MIRRLLCLSLIAAFTAGCSGDISFDDRSDEVPIRHRIPSK